MMTLVTPEHQHPIHGTDIHTQNLCAGTKSLADSRLPNARSS